MKPINAEQLTIFDDLNPHKLHRTNDPETSKDAAYSIPLAKLRAFVLGLIEDSGNKGVTVKEMNKKFPDVGYTSLSPRPSELERLNLIFYVGDRRDGARVIRHIKHKTN